MSLVGNLEDLGLGDILQIVSLSRKSGVLCLQGQQRQGRVVFLNGQVIRASSDVYKGNLGDLLVDRGLVDLNTLREALKIQRSMANPQRIGAILIEHFGIDSQVVDQLVREQIEKIVYSFFAWTDGTFSFELGDSGELANTSFDPLQFMLDQGLNPQWLAMEGSRLLDEKRHRGESLEEDGSANRIRLEDLLDDPSGFPLSREVEASKNTPTEKSSLFNLGAELREEMGEDRAESTRKKVTASPGLNLLRGMLQELTNPSLGGGIILLVLRFASELMNRAVIFLVKEQEIVGLGQFGMEDSDGSMADVRVRRMKIPRHEPSVFNAVLDDMTPCRLTPGQGRWDSYLQEQLGGGAPEEIFLGPIVSEGKVVAILYGDNLPEIKVIGDTESLEIFLSQAGLAMEKALLERRLRGRELS
jgi:hypothetical protein